MADPELQVDMVTRSLNQYVTNALLPQVRFSGGTGSISALVHTSGGAMLLFCLGSCQLDGCVMRSFMFSFAAWLRLRMLPVRCIVRGSCFVMRSCASSELVKSRLAMEISTGLCRAMTDRWVIDNVQRSCVRVRSSTNAASCPRLMKSGYLCCFSRQVSKMDSCAYVAPR